MATTHRILLLSSLDRQSAPEAVLPATNRPLVELQRLAGLHPGRLLALEHDCSHDGRWVRYAWAGGTIREDAIREEIEEREGRWQR